jgi:hypothetical protein
MAKGDLVEDSQAGKGCAQTTQLRNQLPCIPGSSANDQTILSPRSGKYRPDSVY